MDSTKTTANSPRLSGAWAAWLADESGVTAIEYGLLAALIVITCIATFSVVGTQMAALYTFWSAAVSAAIGGAL